MSQEKFRLGQINILNVRKGLEERYERLVDHVEANAIEVLCLQEVVEPRLVQEKLSKAGLKYFAQGMSFTNYGDEEPDCVAIASRYPIANFEHVEFPFEERYALYAELLVRGTKLNLFSAHLAWGSYTEGRRLEQARILSNKAREIYEAEPHSVVCLGMDSNADDDSRTSRYLRGLDLDQHGESVYWTDAYLACGADPALWATTDQGKGELGAATAAIHGITRPDLLPARRIDLLMSFGWRYGRRGSPLAFGRFGDPLPHHSMELSDHYGIWTDIMI